MARRHVLHPLVTILKPNGRKPRRARWVDPATGKKRVFNLPEDKDEADRWLLKKSAALLNKRGEAGSAEDVPPVPLKLAIEKYMQEQHRSRPSTLVQYRYSLNRFEEFVGKKPLSQFVLRNFRASINRPELAPESVNRDLRHVKAFLRHARKNGDVRLSSDEIGDGLELLKIKGSKKKKPLSLAEIAKLQRDLIDANDPLYYRFVMVTLLTGMRRAENERLAPSQVCGDLSIELGNETKTHRGRVIDLAISPTVPALLGKNFKGWKFTADQLRERRNRIHPWVTFQRLRVTCGTYLACAGGIFASSSAYNAALRLGHSVTVAEKSYLGAVTISNEHKTLEAAMGLAPHPTAAE